MKRFTCMLAAALAASGCRDALESGANTHGPLFSHTSGGVWTPIAGMGKERYSHAAAAGRDGKIYVFGGQGQNHPVLLASAEAYDPASDDWTPIAVLPDERLFAGAALGGDGAIYVAGGTSLDVDFNSVLRYDPAGNNYTTIAPMSFPRIAPGVTAGLDGRVYVTGGGSGVNAAIRRTAEVYDPATRTWSTIASMAEGRLGHAAATGHDGRIYVFGGVNAFSTELLSSGEAYDPATGMWTAIAALPRPRANHNAATGSDGHIYVMGGHTLNPEEPCCIEVLDEVWAYDPADDSWTEMTSMSAVRVSAAAAAVGDRVYVVGGYTNVFVLRDSEWFGTRVTLTVAIDIKPGGAPNSINRKSKGNVPVALLSSSSFDATSANRSTVEFAGAPALPIGAGTQDVNGDGRADVVFHFATQALDLAGHATEACLTGSTAGGQAFTGCDSVRIVK